MLIITDKKIIGRREKINFPELGLENIDAKIDTGAYTAALHCHDIKTYRKKGTLYVAFYILDPGHPQYNDKQIKMPVISRRRIKSTSGREERRVIISTSLKLGDTAYRLEISLTNRSRMEFPVLLGRKFLSSRFIVDVTQYNVLSKPRPKSGKK